MTNYSTDGEQNFEQHLADLHEEAQNQNDSESLGEVLEEQEQGIEPVESLLTPEDVGNYSYYEQGEPLTPDETLEFE